MNNNSRMRLHRQNDIATLELCRLPGNVMDTLFFEELATLVIDVLPGLPLAGLVVTGEGRHFSSGADVNELVRRIQTTGTSGAAAFLNENVAVFAAFERLAYPTLAAIRGCCLGAGLELALACRYRIATHRAVMGLVESTYGLIPGCGGTVRLSECIGPAQALDCILTGRTFDAAEALAMGLVSAVVDKENMMDTAQQILRQTADIHGTRP